MMIGTGRGSIQIERRITIIGTTMIGMMKQREGRTCASSVEVRCFARDQPSRNGALIFLLVSLSTQATVTSRSCAPPGRAPPTAMSRRATSAAARATAPPCAPTSTSTATSATAAACRATSPGAHRTLHTQHSSPRLARSSSMAAVQVLSASTTQ